MDAAIPDDHIWVHNIEAELMRFIRSRARANGRTVEVEAKALIKIGLTPAKNQK
jgi:plasmid stability protein